MKIADTLRIARIKENLTQEELSEQVGISTVTISAIENGKVKPHSSTRNKIEEALGAIDWMRTYDEGMINQPVN